MKNYNILTVAKSLFNSMNMSIINKTNEISKIQFVENELGKIAGYSFVKAFSFTAKSICEMLPDPYTETYIRLANTAIEMLLGGEDPAEVLWYFDLKLERLKRGVE